MSKAAELANLIGNINAGGGGVNRNVIINGDFKVKQRAGTGTQSTDLGFDSKILIAIACVGMIVKLFFSQNP